VIWIFLLVVLMIPLMAVVLDSQLGRALARRIEGGRPGDDARISALEAEVERLVREVERLQEQSEFVERLLEERSDEALPPGEAGA
jgi:cell division protein FtsB